MEAYTEIIQVIALTLGASWASGINLYAAMMMLGFLGLSGNAPLPADLQILTSPVIIAAAGTMYLIEFFADKIPGVDTGWDSLHTFIRVPAGALLAYGATNDINQSLGIAAAILGGGVAAGTHATKAGTRVLINTSPEPFSNWFASVGEDVAVIAGIWMALNHPAIFLMMLAVFIVLMIWLLPKIWRGIKKVFGFIAGLFKEGKEPTSDEVPLQLPPGQIPVGDPPLMQK